MPDSQEPTLTITPPGMAVPERGGLAKRRQQRLLTSGELFVKKYRTEIAASASSCVSTFIAVSYIALITIGHWKFLEEIENARFTIL